MKRLPIIIACLMAALTGCSRQEQPVVTHLTVQGWIENGGHPLVMVAETIPMDGEARISQAAMMEHIAKWAKVSVSDGENTVYLTGNADTDYFPPYVFTTARMTGEVGKTYTLEVEYKDFKARAVTTIPEPVPVERISAMQMADSLFTLQVGFIDPPQKGQYYKVFTRTTGIDTHYHPSAMAQFSDEVLDGYSEFRLFSVQRLLDLIDRPNYKLGEEVWIKMCTTDAATYNYWNNFELMLATNANATIWLDPDMQSNMEGALGYWAGYGVEQEYSVILR